MRYNRTNSYHVKKVVLSRCIYYAFSRDAFLRYANLRDDFRKMRYVMPFRVMIHMIPENGCLPFSFDPRHSRFGNHHLKLHRRRTRIPTSFKEVFLGSPLTENVGVPSHTGKDCYMYSI